MCEYKNQVSSFSQFMDFLRIYLIGQNGVGKSALVVRYLTQKFVTDCSNDTGELECHGIFVSPC